MPIRFGSRHRHVHVAFRVLTLFGRAESMLLNSTTMLSMTETPCRKRRKLSPEYDDDFGPMSQAELQAFDTINSQLTQSTRLAYQDTPRSVLKRASPDDDDNPFSNDPVAQSKTTAGLSLFTSAAALPIQRQENSSPSPESSPRQPAWDSWFDSDVPDVDTTVAANFSAASLFKTASNKSFMPSKQALEKAMSKMKEWEAAPEPDPLSKPVSTASPAPKPAVSLFQNASSLARPQPSSPKGKGKENIPQTPSTPSPATFSRPKLPGKTLASAPNRVLPFKSPMIAKAHAHAPSPLNPLRSRNGPLYEAQRQTPAMSSTSFIPPSVAGFATPMRPSKPRSIGRTPNTFRTPFKAGVPTTPRLETPKISKAVPEPIRRPSFFNLKPQRVRLDLGKSGLVPQSYSREELDDLGLDVPTLENITPETAIYYYFRCRSPKPSPEDKIEKLGADEALGDLLSRGCALATKEWVDNHWTHILLKLAGMAALDPDSEANAETRRWCYREVLRQMLYRYERELNQGCRPALRKIVASDAFAASPIVLYVADITWQPASHLDDGTVVPRRPSLTVSDGWYSLPAQLDEPLVNAVKKGVLRRGVKFGTVGARLDSDKKEPQEILDAGGSVRLVLSANSTNLVPWHAKLGFTAGPCISTLNALSPTGGQVSTMDLVVVKAWPIAFVEFVDTGEGHRRTVSLSEAEEAKAADKWQRGRENKAEALKIEVESKVSGFQGYIERLERKGGNIILKDSDDPPENLDDLFDDLEYPDTATALFSRISSREAAWLAVHTKKSLEGLRERIYEDLHKQLNDLFPPRNTRSFRVLLMKDAQTNRRPANRVAKVTVWDVLNLTVAEGRKPGEFKEGDRYLVSNLMPNQPNAWMGREAGSEIYLVARPATRWRMLKGDP